MSPRFPQNSLTDLAVFSAPGVFLVLWSSGFIGSKLGMPYAEPMTFLTIRMAAVVVLLGVIVLITKPKWPVRADLWHSAMIGLWCMAAISVVYSSRSRRKCLPAS